jgi:LysR family glycine cleavage system transcriptional activator
MDRLPPLNPLRAFEAVGRLHSIRRAAEELSVTPGAVSRQVQSLESHLGTPLFRREPREIVLTAEGE